MSWRALLVAALAFGIAELAAWEFGRWFGPRDGWTTWGLFATGASMVFGVLIAVVVVRTEETVELARGEVTSLQRAVEDANAAARAAREAAESAASAAEGAGGAARGAANAANDAVGAARDAAGAARGAEGAARDGVTAARAAEDAARGAERSAREGNTAADALREELASGDFIGTFTYDRLRQIVGDLSGRWVAEPFGDRALSRAERAQANESGIFLRTFRMNDRELVVFEGEDGVRNFVIRRDGRDSLRFRTERPVSVSDLLDTL